MLIDTKKYPTHAFAWEFCGVFQNWCFVLTNFKPCSIYIFPENVRKPMVFGHFVGYGNRTLAKNCLQIFLL